MTPSLADYARAAIPPPSPPPRSRGTSIRSQLPTAPPPLLPAIRALHALGVYRPHARRDGPAALAFAIPFFILAASPSGSPRDRIADTRGSQTRRPAIPPKKKPPAPPFGRGAFRRDDAPPAPDVPKSPRARGLALRVRDDGPPLGRAQSLRGERGDRLRRGRLLHAPTVHRATSAERRLCLPLRQARERRLQTLRPTGSAAANAEAPATTPPPALGIFAFFFFDRAPNIDSAAEASADEAPSSDEEAALFGSSRFGRQYAPGGRGGSSFLPRHRHRDPRGAPPPLLRL